MERALRVTLGLYSLEHSRLITGHIEICKIWSLRFFFFFWRSNVRPALLESDPIIQWNIHVRCARVYLSTECLKLQDVIRKVESKYTHCHIKSD